MSKFKILVLAIKKIKNWTILPKVYFGIHNDEYFRINLKNGISLKLRTNSTDINAFVNVWLLEDYFEAKNILKDKDIVLDVGSHIGLFCIYASQYCKNGKIYCFEPVKTNYQLLVENIENNNLKNIFCFNQAVFHNEKTVKIFLNEDDAAHSLYGTGSKFIEIETTTIKEIMNKNEISICNLLKLDCEGSEYEILSSITSEYYRKIKKILLEYHFADSEPKKLDRLKKRLLSEKFVLENYPSKDGMGMLHAK